MAIKGILIFIAGIIIGALLVYFLTHTNAVNYENGLNSGLAGNSASQTQSTQLSSCQSQVQSVVNILRAKGNPSDQISVVNTTVFGSYTNKTDMEITSWANTWQTNQVALGYGCDSGNLAGYLCSDINTIQNGSMNSTGMAVKIAVTTASGSETVVYPLLCGNGNLLRSSNYSVSNHVIIPT